KTTHESKIHKNDSLSGLNAAYIIYTSGSTGKPKGVMITHDELSEHCVSMREYYSITDNDRIMQFSSLNFDASLEQIFTALISGATLFLRDKEIWLPTEFLGNIIENKLTIANIPPAYWLELINEWTKTPEILADTQLRLLIIGGEKISGDILSKWQHINNKKIRLLNAYGPTETTITSLIFDIPDNYNCTGKNVPIGKPCRGRALYLLNNDFYPVPRTVKSELFIGGKSLARGYNSDPALTAEKFLPDPFSIEPGQRMYRTGDIVKFLPDHNVEFIGRADNQIKIRGFRIELGEIESAIRESGLFANALVVLQEEAQESKKLIAYLVNREIHNENTVIGKLRDYLSESLPRYMIPSEYVLIKSIPLMPNGKIDRKALPELNRQAEKLEMMETEPKNNIEKKIAEILQEILKKEKISRSDNFFDLGGHSLLGIQAVIKIKEKFKISLKVSDLFDNPTVKDLSRIVIDQLVKNSDAKILEEKLNKLEEIPRIN
ncbi:MAG: non-ribosomal peptide synthetase, partial [Methanococcaceae archaeon]